MDDIQDLVSVPSAAQRAEVSRDAMYRAARDGKIRAVKLGRAWFVYGSDIDRWKKEHYRPDKAIRYPKKADSDESRE